MGLVKRPKRLEASARNPLRHMLPDASVALSSLKENNINKRNQIDLGERPSVLASAGQLVALLAAAATDVQILGLLRPAVARAVQAELR